MVSHGSCFKFECFPINSLNLAYAYEVWIFFLPRLSFGRFDWKFTVFICISFMPLTNVTCINVSFYILSDIVPFEAAEDRMFCYIYPRLTRVNMIAFWYLSSNCFGTCGSLLSNNRIFAFTYFLDHIYCGLDAHA